MKKFFVKFGTLVIILTMLICALSLTASAETYTGECGESAAYTIFTHDSGCTLNISGTGEMQNWNSDDKAPWDSYTENIKTIYIDSGIKTIGNASFSLCKNLTTVNIPDTVTSIGKEAFASCESLTQITIPNSVTAIGEKAFANCKSLTDIYFKGTQEQWNAIAISKGNDLLTGATIHYSYTAAEKPNEITDLNSSNVTPENSTASEEEIAVAETEDSFKKDLILTCITAIITGFSTIALTLLVIWILKKLFRLIKKLYNKYKSKQDNPPIV